MVLLADEVRWPIYVFKNGSRADRFVDYQVIGLKLGFSRPLFVYDEWSTSILYYILNSSRVFDEMYMCGMYETLCR